MANLIFRNRIQPMPIQIYKQPHTDVFSILTTARISITNNSISTIHILYIYYTFRRDPRQSEGVIALAAHSVQYYIYTFTTWIIARSSQLARTDAL